jgi:hypothetical protein
VVDVTRIRRCAKPFLEIEVAYASLNGRELHR